MSRLVGLLTAVTLVAVFISACDTAHTVAPAPPVAPAATSPEAAVKVLEWGFNNRNVDAIAGLLPEGCSLESAELDTAGDSVVTDVWRRQDLLATFNAMFNGDTGAPAASKLRMNLGENLVAFPDDRPGRSGGIHRAVRSSLDVEVVTGEGNVYRPEGHLLCYVTRGDSAMIPPELVARGVQADSTRWWIDRIEDETTSSHSRPGLHTTPSNVWSFGEVLLFWHHGPPRP